MKNDLVDSLFFTRLAQLDPVEVCLRTGCTYDETARTYGLTVWGKEYAVDLRKVRVVVPVRTGSRCTGILTCL